MLLLAIAGVAYLYVVIVVLPTVRSGLVQRPKLPAGCSPTQVIAAWAAVVYTALFRSAHLTARRHKNAPAKLNHTVTNEELATLARKAAIRFTDASRPLQARTARVLRALARLKLRHGGGRRRSHVHQTTMLKARHQRVRSDSSPAALLSALQRLRERRLSASNADTQQQLPQLAHSHQALARLEQEQEQDSAHATPPPATPKRPSMQKRRSSLADTLTSLWRGGSDMTYYLGMLNLEGVDMAIPRVRRKLTVVLDLDECLVHSAFSAGGEKYRQKEARPTEVTHVDCLTIELGPEEHVIVNRRPGLDAFLEQLCVDYHVVVFTAGVEEYASKVLDLLDPEAKYFHHRLYRTSCRQARGGIFLKDLDSVAALERSGACTCLAPQPGDGGLDGVPLPPPQLVGEPLERMVLVDNSPLSFICQPSNGILVSSWYDNANDDALASVLRLIRHVDACDDVRPTLSACFGLEPVLKEYQEFVLSVGYMDSRPCTSPQQPQQGQEQQQLVDVIGAQASDDAKAQDARLMDDVIHNIDIKLHRKPSFALTLAPVLLTAGACAG